MNLDNKAAVWNIADGIEHNMTSTVAIIRLPIRKPELVFGHINDPFDALIDLRASGNAAIGYKLDAFHDSIVYGVMDTNYILGTPFTFRISAFNGVVRVYYNNMNTPSFSFSAVNTGCYFKLGNHQVITSI
jgi:hypothetical protein